MIKRIGNIQIRFYISRLEKRIGICSQDYTNIDKHMLLWDFDRSPLYKIRKSLKIAQVKYKLPTILIVQSSTKGSYHAYCLASRSFLEVIHILSSVPELDVTYLRLGIVRGYFTLRITPRKNDKFRIADVLLSSYSDEMTLFDCTVSEYLTSNKGMPIKNKGGKRNAKGSKGEKRL